MKRYAWLWMVLVLMLVAVGSGCSKKAVGSASATPEGGYNENEDAARTLEESKRVIVLEKIYFAFNSSDLTPQGREILTRKAEIIREKPSLKVIIEGNCDERGTHEYNLALGERRAQSAYTYLVNLGINPSQLETISYGKERPADPGHGEAAWALNRRDEFRLVW